MKTFATLVASAYAATKTESTNPLPTMMDTAETANSAAFATGCGSWSWILYGATDSADEDGYYLKVTSSGATKQMKADGSALEDIPAPTTSTNAEYNYGGETGLIIYATDADNATTTGQEVLFLVKYETTTAGDGAATVGAWADATLTQSFNAAGSITSTGTTKLAGSANTGTNAWKLNQWDDAAWDGTSGTKVSPSSIVFRLTPDESTSTDPRPEVGTTATAYYLLAQDEAAAAGTTQQVTGT